MFNRAQPFVLACDKFKKKARLLALRQVIHIRHFEPSLRLYTRPTAGTAGNVSTPLELLEPLE